MNELEEHEARHLLREVRLKTNRSAGSGGQHVNKVETKVTLFFDVANTGLLDPDQKKLLYLRQKNRINKKGILILHCDTERSQLANKKKVQERFLEILKSALKRKAVRKKTKPSKSKQEERLKKKKMLSEKKQRRDFNFRDRFSH